MSPLWTYLNIKQLIKIQNKPSPKRVSNKRIFAQNLFIDIFLSGFIKGISLFTSRFRRLDAGMTVEAALVLPLFLFFFLNLGSAIEMIRLHSKIEFALYDIGKRISVYGYVLAAETDEEPTEGMPEEEEQEGEWLRELKDAGLSYTYIKRELVDYLGRQYLEESPIVNGIDGLQFLESEIFDGEDCFEITVTYRVAPFGEIAGFKGFRMANKYYGHLWNGYHIPDAEDVSRENIVYVTEYGSAYHQDASCSHLFLTVREVSLQEAYSSRNSNGAKYELCLYCAVNSFPERVYITEDGDKIHYQKDCTGLKRTVYEIPRDEAVGYIACSRCVKVQ